MGRRIRIKATARREPDIRLYVLALIALARQLQEEEEPQQQGPQSARPSAQEGGTAHG
jgi:hypothetical protein